MMTMVILKYDGLAADCVQCTYMVDDGADTDERFSDCVCGRGGLLPSERCNCVCRKRGECTSFDPATCSDHAAQCPRHQGPL